MTMEQRVALQIGDLILKNIALQIELEQLKKAAPKQAGESPPEQVG